MPPGTTGMTIPDRKSKAASWFAALRERICAAFEAVEDDYAGPDGASLPPGRFVRTRVAAAGRRRRHDRADAWPGVREGRGQRLDRVRRVRAGIPRRDPRRGRRSAVLGERHLARRPYALAAGAGRAHEHPPHCHNQGLVRRRRRPDPDLPRSRGGRAIPRRPCRAPATATIRTATPASSWCDEYFYPAAPRRAARRRRDLFRLSRQRRLGARFRLCRERSARRFSRSFRRSCGRG